jgi:hypothetical protein
MTTVAKPSFVARRTLRTASGWRLDYVASFTNGSWAARPTAYLTHDPAKALRFDTDTAARECAEKARRLRAADLRNEGGDFESAEILYGERGSRRRPMQGGFAGPKGS